MKQKTKYRYFFCRNARRLIRFTSKGDGKDGQWLFDNGFSDKFSGHPISFFLDKNSEVTLSQGLHYVKGNYCE